MEFEDWSDFRDRAHDFLEESFLIAEELNNTEARITLLWQRARNIEYSGNLNTAQSYYEEALNLSHSISDNRLIVLSIHYYGGYLVCIRKQKSLITFVPIVMQSFMLTQRKRKN